MPKGKGNLNSNAHWISTALADHGKVVLGIGGGVGPSAGVGLHNKIIYNTKTDGTDQTHFQVNFGRFREQPPV